MAFDAKEILNTEDTTATMDPKDIQENKFMAILSYIGPLVFIPFFARKNSPFAQYHAKRGLNLFILQAIVSVALSVLAIILGSIPGGNIINWLISTPVSLAMTALSVIGIVNAAMGKCKELPVVSGIKFIK